MLLEKNSDEVESKKSKELKRYLIIIGLSALLFIVFVLSLYFFHFNFSFSRQNADWGTFGDFVGGSLNPVFSFLSLMALLFTIKLQSEELSMSRKELKRSADALKAQSLTQNIQRFESTYFSLLKLHGEALEKMLYEGVKGSPHTTLMEAISLGLLKPSESQSSSPSIFKEKKLEEYKTYYEPYTVVLFQVLNYLNMSNPRDSNGNPITSTQNGLMNDSSSVLIYRDILMSALTNDVLCILSLVCYRPVPGTIYYKLKPLIEGFSLLQNLPDYPFGFDGEGVKKIRNNYACNAFMKTA